MQILGNIHESVKPDMILLLYEHLQERGLTPYAMVVIDYPGVSVPSGFDNDGIITLDVSASACRDFLLADGWISFRARFRGVVQQVQLPVAAIRALYAQETQEGLQFSIALPEPSNASAKTEPAPNKPAKDRQKPALKVVK